MRGSSGNAPNEWPVGVHTRAESRPSGIGLPFPQFGHESRCAGTNVLDRAFPDASEITNAFLIRTRNHNPVCPLHYIGVAVAQNRTQHAGFQIPRRQVPFHRYCGWRIPVQLSTPSTRRNQQTVVTAHVPPTRRKSGAIGPQRDSTVALVDLDSPLPQDAYQCGDHLTGIHQRILGIVPSVETAVRRWSRWNAKVGLARGPHFELLGFRVRKRNFYCTHPPEINRQPGFPLEFGHIFRITAKAGNHHPAQR